MVSVCHISKANRQSAIENIQRKIRFLQDLREGVFPADTGFSTKIAVPTSLRAFNAWSVSDKSISFKANAAETLRNDSALTTLVLALLKEINEINRKQKDGKKIPSIEKKLLGEIVILRAQLASLETQYALDRVQMSKLERKHESLNVRKKNQEAEFVLTCKALESKINKLEVENRQLIKTLSKVAPVR